MKKVLKKQRFTQTIILSLLVLAAQSVFAYDENRELKNFSEIAFSISGDLYLTQGNSFSIKIEGDQKDVEKIITKVEGNTLIIKVDNHWKSYGDVKVYVTLPKLEELALAGSGNIIAKSAFAVDGLEMSVAGSGDIFFDNLTTQKTEISVAGSGDIKLVGSSGEKLEISIAGSGDINATEFKAQKVEVDISGSGTAKVYATDKLETSIVGSGSVYYKGDPKVDASSIGSGRTLTLK